MPGKGIVLATDALWQTIKGVADRDERNKRLAEGVAPSKYSTWPTKARNSSGGNRALGDVLELTGELLTTTTNNHLWFDGGTPTGGARFCILRRPTLDGDIGDVTITGCCVASVNVLNTAHGFAGPISGSHSLASSATGPVKLLSIPSGTGVDLLAVAIGGADTRNFLFKNSASEIAARSGVVPGSGTVTLMRLVAGEIASSGITRTLYNWSSQVIAANAYGMCHEDPDGTTWVGSEDCTP